MKFLFFSFFMSLYSASYAQDATEEQIQEKKMVTVDLSGSFDNRGVLQLSSERETIETSLSIVGKVDVKGHFEIIGVIRTAGNFESSYIRDVNFMDHEDNFFIGSTQMTMRNLYVQKVIKDHLFQIGALQTDSGIGIQTGLSSNGWLDGIRYKLDSDYGKIMVSGGYLSANDQIDVGVRVQDFDFNFVEISLSKEFLEHISVQMGYEYFNQESFLDVVIKEDLENLTGKVITLISEAIVNVDTGALVASAGASVDVLSLFKGEPKGIILSAAYVYRSDDASGRIGNDYRRGLYQCNGNHCVFLELSAPLDKQKNISVFAGVRFEEEFDFNRYEAGLKIKFGKKKKK